MELLEGTRIEEKISVEEDYSRKGEPKEKNMEEEWEKEELEIEEIVQAVKSMKKNKAAGYDEISIWLYGGAAVRTGLTEIIKQMWKEGIMPKDWKTSVIVPIFKKGDQEKTENYRDITLCTAYKIFAEILRERLEMEVDRKMIMPERQCGEKEEGLLIISSF